MDLQTLEKYELIDNIKLLEVKIEELEESNRNNKSLLALLAHDFKGTFSNLLWILNLYNNKKVPLEALIEMMPELEISTCKSLKAIDDTFLSAKIQYDNIWTEKETVNLKDIYTEIKEELAEEISKKELAFEFIGDEEFSILGSKLIVKSILVKVIDNAIKFSHQGGLIKCIVEKGDNDRVQVTIEDFGTGMDEYTFKKLFTLDIVPAIGTVGEKGAGFGLVLANEAIQLMNGKIDIVSTKETGTQVQITL